jgi:SNF family Na+-dependent transporter
LPDRNIDAALGFMWNPKPLEEGGSLLAVLTDATVWLEAAGQIFFSIGIGFGLILCYASYLDPDEDDVTLNGLTGVATNELCEVCLGGLITIPAAFLFLGAAPLAAVAGSSIGLGFHALPVVFEYLPAGDLFGFLWFGLLFLAAMTSAVAMLQPAVAFFEGGLGLGRGPAVAATGGIALAGTAIVVWFSRHTIALDVMDFWVGSVALVVLALFEVILFAWIVGAERGIEEANRSSDLVIPRGFAFLVRWVCPLSLLFILGNFVWSDFPDQARALAGSTGAIVTTIFMAVVLAGLALLAEVASRRRGAGS